MKQRKGFTLLETIVTLSIIGASFALTAGVVAALLNVQKKSNSQLLVNKDLKRADTFIKNYVSFVSLHNESVSFSVKNVNDTNVKCGIDGTTYTYTLSFVEHSLSISNTYTGSESYFKKVDSITIDSIDKIKFSYDSTISLLLAEMKTESSLVKYAYVLR